MVLTPRSGFGAISGVRRARGLSGPPPTDDDPLMLNEERSGRRRAVWIGAGYAAQGFGYAAVVTALPEFKARQGIDDAYVSVILLLVCVAAAAGSVLADKAAARWGSR